MKTNINELFRSGKILIKYRLNLAGTKHSFYIEYKGFYFGFLMLGGVLINVNETPSNTLTIKGSKRKSKYFSEYYNSSLNSAFNG